MKSTGWPTCFEITWYASWSQFEPGKTITPNFTLLSPRGSLRLWDWKGLRAPFSRLIRERVHYPSTRRARSRNISPAARRKCPRSRVARPNADGFSLRVEHSGFKVHINFGFHLL